MNWKINNNWPWLVFLSLFLGCGVPERPKVLTISKPPAFTPSRPEEIRTIEQAMTAIITACKDNLGLPAVNPLLVFLYKNTASFAFYGHGWTTLPFDVSYQAAFSQGNKINVNLEEIPEDSFGLVRVLAHEYAHTLQYDIAGKEPRVARWVTEGFAEWVAAKVLHSLKWQDYALTLYRARLELIRHRALLPKFSFLSSDQGWESVLRKPKGLIRSYGLAFVAIDRLIDQKGLSATIRYLGAEDFQATFGQSGEDFVLNIEKYLLEMKSPKQTKFTIDKADWKIGYQWTYAERRPGVSGTLVKEVIREDTFQGFSSFVVRSGRREDFYAKENLGMLGSMENEKVISKNNKPEQTFAWPLDLGKEWRNSFSRKTLQKKSSGDVDRQVIISGVEEVEVPAGVFETVKIEAYGLESGRLREEYWYSPEVKWFVKNRTYTNEEGVIEKDLLSFKVF